MQNNFFFLSKSSYENNYIAIDQNKTDWKIIFLMYSPGSKFTIQSAKKVVSDSSGQVDFVIRLVNSLFNLPDKQVMFFEQFG